MVGEQCTCSWGSVVGGGVTFDLCHKKSQERGVWAPKLKDKGKEKERSLGLGKDRHWAVGQISRRMGVRGEVRQKHQVTPAISGLCLQRKLEPL